LGGTSDIDRLIELGLNRYGAGDLEGALLMWEEALAIDPFNAQATSYVDYVRLNYDLLTSGEPSVDESLDTKFAIEEEPEYQIEIIEERASEPALPGVELPKVASVIALDKPVALMSTDQVDAGWDIEETQDTSSAFPGATQDAAPAMPAMQDEPEPPILLLGADEPPADEPEPPPIQLEADEPPPREPVSFEDATREYHGAVQNSARPMIPLPADYTATEPTHSEFNQDEYTGGFSGPQATPAGFTNQDTGIRQRDLGFVKPTAASTPAGSGSRLETADLELGQYDATQERAPRYDAGGNGAEEPQHSDSDLIDSLPTPTSSEPESGEIRLPQKSASTRDMALPTRQPAAKVDTAAVSQAEVMLSHAPTRELTPADLRGRALDPLVTAPTRELGLRPGKLTSPEDDDIPTGQSDARAIRAAAARDDGGAGQERPGTEGTKHDIVLPFDPIAALAAQILDDVDAGAPAGEPAEERTRRRITRLLELASEWNTSGETDKAVSAVDLALSEDPNSALGQKLITRNKDTITSLFQHYLGDLERTPQLAKPLHELANAPISPRAAFLLSRIDGMLTIDELLDVSGMPRLEAYRHLCQLYLRGILR
jgi:hypothetical protein